MLQDEILNVLMNPLATLIQKDTRSKLLAKLDREHRELLRACAKTRLLSRMTKNRACAFYVRSTHLPFDL